MYCIELEKYFLWIFYSFLIYDYFCEKIICSLKKLKWPKFYFKISLNIFPIWGNVVAITEKLSFWKVSKNEFALIFLTTKMFFQKIWKSKKWSYLVKWAKNEKIKALYFLENQKLEKIICSYFIIFWLNFRDMAIFLFYVIFNKIQGF